MKRNILMMVLMMVLGGVFSPALSNDVKVAADSTQVATETPPASGEDGEIKGETTDETKGENGESRIDTVTFDPEESIKTLKIMVYLMCGALAMLALVVIIAMKRLRTTRKEVKKIPQVDSDYVWSLIRVDVERMFANKLNVTSIARDQTMQAEIKKIVGEAVREAMATNTVNNGTINNYGGANYNAQQYNGPTQVIPPVREKVYYADSSNGTTELNVGEAYRNKTIYVLSVNPSTPNVATVDICVDNKQVIFAALDETLSAVCDVTKESMSPSAINTQQVGRAEKINETTWRVVEPIKVVVR